ncbi:TIGR03758 family integrating conjugative element protein [Providencia sp.]|uniref:TIGR03758 family integrating conjugative element protein n=1 Tax=Providencia sp. TaxID=589 RepID=UPI00333ED4A7
MSDLSSDQVAAFNANSGFMPENLGTLILGIFFATLIVWGVWAIKTAYAGWSSQQLTHKEFFMVVVRYTVIYIVMTFILLS